MGPLPPRPHRPLTRQRRGDDDRYRGAVGVAFEVEEGDGIIDVCEEQRESIGPIREAAREPDGKRERARQLLTERLAGGPVLERILVQFAEAEGISETTLKRAKKDLGITSAKAGFADGWLWQMPETIASMEGNKAA